MSTGPREAQALARERRDAERFDIRAARPADGLAVAERRASLAAEEEHANVPVREDLPDLAGGLEAWSACDPAPGQRAPQRTGHVSSDHGSGREIPQTCEQVIVGALAEQHGVAAEQGGR